MITTGALIHGDVKRFLHFHPLEHPIALQLGGSEPDALAYCAKLGAEYGYDEINLNVGCPSDRVQSGRFGACLMLDPTLVADSVNAMVNAVSIPVTVKCRIGVDHEDSYELLHAFITLISKAGCNVFIIHARKAWLQGLSPKQNREVPPLRYDVVRQIKQDFPHLTIIMNGGIKTIAEMTEHLSHVDGVMIGREAYTNPYLLADIEEHYFSSVRASREKIIEQLIPYVELQLQNKVKLSHITRHILGLFQGQRGGRLWRRYLSENAHKVDAGVNVIWGALKEIPS
jgi:tRNA-dihydrouridine synthase A